MDMIGLEDSAPMLPQQSVYNSPNSSRAAMTANWSSYDKPVTGRTNTWVIPLTSRQIEDNIAR
jgi:hypothetical protein